MSGNSSMGGRWLMALVAVACLAFLILFALPQQPNRTGAREAEAKQNLHCIQLALERYAVDNDGPYPLWISGGSFVDGTDGQIDSRYIADPLISEGYMPKYPRNPFQLGSRTKPSITQLRDLQESLNDPLRPDETASILPPAYRFGRDYDLMGSVLADPRFADILSGSDADGKPVRQRTGADVPFPCWDTVEQKPRPAWLQGQFFYKSFGAVVASAAGNSAEAAAGGSSTGMPSGFTADMYMLGSFGSMRTKGQDVLGFEQPLAMRTAAGKTLQLINLTGIALDGQEERPGSPFRMKKPADGEDVAAIEFGNPNGIADGIIIVLTAGQAESMLRERTTASEQPQDSR